ncbi:E3 ubiquitin-protein ligase NRDP1-like [Styela clava]|uniref:LOW QUALITY PROTEIN: E3 ubiquitin-protein ligase NRDP1-like n=1 Tax=Styela clava TaxID=7725 RepID=UPI001939E5A3|nr:LOW QUALITY PROTEIN: E3 ubiquitin-protein ligase NRDP1-like [Styela clava]
MGFDLMRFSGRVDEELMCVICGGVLEDPVMVEECEHCFCKCCIEAWLQRQQTCPVDRSQLQTQHLKPVPRIMRNMLGRLTLMCENRKYGCATIVRLDQLLSHQTECDFNPKKPIQCTRGCGVVVPKDEMSDHNCIRELRCLVNKQKIEINDLNLHKVEANKQISELKHEVSLLKEYIKALKIPTNPSLQIIQQRMEQDDVIRWGSSLTLARVTRWGGVISTPDVVLQTVIKRALIDTQCPLHIVNDLMENAHERRWPVGLSTLETRQLHRRQYEDYVTKRIPGKQAIVILQCENNHMGDDMILHPGIVIIFAHGVVDVT